MTNYYRIKSPLTQISDDGMKKFISALSTAMDDELVQIGMDEYNKDEDFALLYVASGGSEGYFLESFDTFKGRPCYIITSGDSNSLAASMEILSYLNNNGGKGEILHGDIQTIADRINLLKKAYKAKAALKGKNVGLIGPSSDWLISSVYNKDSIFQKLGMGFVDITIDELIEEYKKESYEENKWTKLIKEKKFDKAEIEKSLWVYGAIKRIVNKYNLGAVSVRCFDLLDTIFTTGCMGLAILNAEGIYAGCEGDIPALISMVVMGGVSGQPCFLCNPSRFDTANGKATLAHCTIPLNMLDSFELDTHFESGIGVAVKGKVSKGACTIFKCSGDLSRYHVQEGEIVETPFYTTLCRTQIVLNIDDFSYFLNNPIGNHHIIVNGAFAKEAETFFSIL